MHRSFAPVVSPIVETVRPQAVVEVGAGFGRLTRRLLASGGAAGATVHAIDPHAAFDADDLDPGGQRLVLHRERSLGVLSRLPVPDIVLLDGDPNWYTVHAELELLATVARRSEAVPPVVVVNNVHWPFGRRDGYYEPDSIPEHARQPHVAGALVPSRAEPSSDGLRIVPFVAQRDLGARNGVMTAVEDFMAAEEDGWRVIELPGYHGVAVLIAQSTAAGRPAVRGLIDLLESPATLQHLARRIEAGRVEAMLAGRRTTDDDIAAHPLPVSVERTRQREAELVARIAELELKAADAIQHQALYEATTWRLEALQQDMAAREIERKEAVSARDAQARAAVEASVRLERAVEDLEKARAELVSSERGATELRATTARQQKQLDELEDRARLLAGRASHLEESLGAAQAEARTARGDALTAERRLEAMIELNEEISRHVRAAARSRAWRLGHGLTRTFRRMTFRRPMKSDGALEVAVRALDRPLLVQENPANAPDHGASDPRARSSA